MAEKFIPSENPTLSLSVNQDNELVAPTAEELLSANPALGILQERTQNMSASPSGTSIEKGLTVSGNLQFSDSISNKPTEIAAPNTVQVKGYFIQYFDKANFSNGTGTMDIYVGDEELTYEQGIENQSSPASTFYNAGLDTQYEVGDLISFRNKYSFICGGQITAISGNKITLGQFTDFVLEEMPNTTTWLPDEGADQTELNFDAYSLWNMTRPTLGSVVLNNIAFAFGANLNSLGKASFAQGFDSNAYGAYSIATGRGTTAGSYAQFVCGRNNSPDYNQKLLFIVGGGWGSDLKNVCTVDYGGNLVLAAGSYPQPSETASITATNGHFSGSIDVESSVSVGSVELTEESLQETQDNISALQTSVTSITSKTQNQSAASGNTSFTGNLTVSGTISTGSMSDIVGNVSQNQSAISEIQSEIPGIQADVSTLTLSKLPYGTLYFDKGKLSGSNFAIPNFPFSICATVRVDAWSGEQNQTIMQFGNAGETPIVSLNFAGTQQSPTIVFQIISTSSVVSSLTCGLDYADFIGKEHTIIAVCRSLDSSATLDWSLYLDGQSLSGAATKNLKIDALSGSGEYAINTLKNNDPSSAASANPMMLRNLCVFNFDISAEGSPYSIADYVAGRLIPPSLIGNQFTGMYGSGWSVSGDTATCSGTSTESYPRITGGVIPSGFNFTFTVDVELSFSGTPFFEIYTNCQRAYAEIYDYSTQLTTKKTSAPGGGFYRDASLGITASGHYRIKFDCKSSLGGGQQIFMVIGALSSGTIILSNTYYTRCNLALENYTIARNATTTLVKDASGNSNDATVQGSGTVAGDNDQSIKVFVDEIKTQINQANG